MAEQVAECQKYGSIEDIPKSLISFLCSSLNDNLNTEKLNVLCYIFNEPLNSKKFPSDLIHELSFQRKLNCNLLIKFLSVCGRTDLSRILAELLSTEEHLEFNGQDLKDNLIIEKQLSMPDGFSLSKRSLPFRLLIVDVLLNSDFHFDELSLIKEGFGLPAVKKERCQNIFEMFVEVEKQQHVNKSSNDTVQFLIDVISCNAKSVAKVEKFRNENLHLF